MAKIGSTDALEFGYDARGMRALDESLQQLLYEDVKQALEELETNVKTELETCWQGESHDAFIVDLEAQIQNIVKEIGVEYEDLQARFVDTAYYYLQQDANLYERKVGN